MLIGGGDLKSFEAKNSMFDEKVFRIEEHKLFFPERYFGYYILALNAWNQSSLIFGTKKAKQKIQINPDKISQDFLENFIQFNNLNANVLINKKTFLEAQTINFWSGFSLKRCDLIDLFLADKGGEEILKNLNQSEFLQEYFNISEEYDFSHLMPNVVKYKEMINDYIFWFITGLATRQSENFTRRIGAILTGKKKGFFSELNKPIRLMETCIREVRNKIFFYVFYKRLKKYNIREIISEGYAKREFSLKEKQSYCYRIGELFIKACKTFYKGGFFKFFFELKKLRKEFKEKY